MHEGCHTVVILCVCPSVTMLVVTYQRFGFLSAHIFISAYFLCLILAVKRMCWYMYNCVHATSFAAQVLAHYLMIDQLSATADCCQQTALEGSELSPMIVHSSEQWDATSRIDRGQPVLLSPKPPVFLESSISSFFSTYYILKWWIMATLGLWQYIAIALLVSLKSGRCHKTSLISAHFSISAYFLTIWTYKHMRLTTWVYGTLFRASLSEPWIQE